MSSPLPPDPYLALGIAKDASAAVIKTTYRKLALKFHPDKVTDESQKEAAADQFHKIQTAYEIVGDEDRRHRYDAQCKLAQLKRDVMERGGRGPVEVRTAAYKVPTEAPRSNAFYTTRGPERTDRTSPVYEERKPAYATDYFDGHVPLATARKDAEYERSSRKGHPRDDRERAKAQTKDAKETERARQSEKSRRRERDRVRERDEKTAHDESSSGDEYERQARKMREEDALRRARAQYHDQARREKEDATHGYYDGNERVRKLYSQYDAAREHIESRRRADSERRPSPERVPSSKDKVEYIKRGEGRPAAVRRGSSRTKVTDRATESRRSSAREGERRSSVEIVDEPRRPPPLVQSKSMPPEIRPSLDRQRSQSVQHEKGDPDLPPKMRRSETMPHVHETSRRKDSLPVRSSGLRQTEIVDGQPTPGITPGAHGPMDPRYRYQTEYADDNEFPTPDGYRTEIREPTPGSRPRYTRSPSPLASRDGRDKPRTASARYGPSISPQRPQPSRTTSTSYVYTPGQGVETFRPTLNRENSSRSERLYGEIPTTATASTRPSAKPMGSYGTYSTLPENARYPKEIRPEDIRVQSGYEYSGSGGRRGGATSRPSYSRTGSSSVYVR